MYFDESISLIRELSMEKGFISSADYAAGMKEQVLPYIEERRQNKELTALDGANLYTSFFTADEPKGTVMLLHGFTENIEKFSEVIFAFLKEGYSVLCYDQRGHGRSYRYPGVESYDITHVGHFEDYLKDAELVYNSWMKDAVKPLILMGHSMGGAVAALILERGILPFDKAVLTSPMVAPATGGFPAWTGDLICRAAILAGKGKKRIFLSKPYTGEEKFEDSCANSRERFDWYDEIKRTTPVFQNSSPTYRWTKESIGVTRNILAKGQPEKVRIPVLILQASDDNTVEGAPQEALAKRLAKGRLVRIENARHEIYRSVDEVCGKWWKEITDFLKEE